MTTNKQHQTYIAPSCTNIFSTFTKARDVHIWDADSMHQQGGTQALLASSPSMSFANSSHNTSKVDFWNQTIAYRKLNHLIYAKNMKHISVDIKEYMYNSMSYTIKCIHIPKLPGIYTLKSSSPSDQLVDRHFVPRQHPKALDRVEC